MDARTYHLEQLIFERAADVRRGTERADEIRASLRASLDAVRRDIPRQDAVRLEGLIDALLGVR